MSKPRKLAKAKEGAKPPVLMIHGAHCGPWVLDGFAEKFARAGYAVARPALRFHDTDKPPSALGETSLSDYAADLDEVMEGLEAPPILVGHSLGGLLAQLLAARRATHACVLLAPAAPWGVPPSTLFEIATAQSMLLNVGFWNKVLEPRADFAGDIFLSRFAAPDRERIFRRFVPESGRATFEIMHWGLDMSHASEVDPEKVTCPLLLLVGDDDRINPPGTVERVAALYGRQAMFEKLPGMGHWLIGEPGWENVCDRVLEWLETV